MTWTGPLILQVDEDRRGTAVSADERTAVHIGLGPVSTFSAKVLPSSPQMVENLFPSGNGLSHNFVA